MGVRLGACQAFRRQGVPEDTHACRSRLNSRPAAASWGHPVYAEPMAARTADARALALRDHLDAPRGRGALAALAAHRRRRRRGLRRPRSAISVRVEGDRVAEAGFDASGCAAARARRQRGRRAGRGRAAAATPRASRPPRSPTRAGRPRARRAAHAADLAADALHRALGLAAPRRRARGWRRGRDRTLVAMSGGVDSAAAAQLALDAGDEVVAVTLELWSDPATDGERSCCSPQAVTGARALAHRMGLPHLTLDLRERFRAEVVDDFLAGYARGRARRTRACAATAWCASTRCSSWPARLGAAHAGHRPLRAHRPRRARARSCAPAPTPPRTRATCSPASSADELERLRFPLGELEKPRVRELARAAGLPVADKPESQDLCFLAGTGPRAFMRRHGGARCAPRRRAARSWTATARCSAATTATTPSRSASGAASAWPPPSRSTCSPRTRARNRVVVGPRGALRHHARAASAPARAAPARRARRRGAAALPRAAGAVPVAAPPPPGAHGALDAGARARGRRRGARARRRA